MFSTDQDGAMWKDALLCIYYISVHVLKLCRRALLSSALGVKY